VGATGDVYEQNADAVADRVVAGKSAEDLLPSGRTSEPSAVQLKKDNQKRGWKISPHLLRKQLVVPKSYGAFERWVLDWMAHCVQSRTKVNGKAVHRERGVVRRSRASLKQCWLRLERLQGEEVSLRAVFDGSPFRPETVRISLVESFASFKGDDMTSKRSSPNASSVARGIESWLLTGKTLGVPPVQARRLACVMNLMKQSGFDDEYISNNHLAQFLDQGQDFDKQVDHVEDTLKGITSYWRAGEKNVVAQQLLALDQTIFTANKRLKRMATVDSTSAMGSRFKQALYWVLKKHGTKNSIYSCYPL